MAACDAPAEAVPEGAANPAPATMVPAMMRQRVVAMPAAVLSPVRLRAIGKEGPASEEAIGMRWKLAVFAIGLALAGCNPDSADQRRLGGAVIGAGNGAVIGRATKPNTHLYRDRNGRESRRAVP